MLLDIIVPHHNESWDVVRPFFDVLGSQKGVNFNDFRITVIHNGQAPEALYFPDDKYFKERGLNTRQFGLIDPGVSKARNYGMDRADAKWIMFCDCDDCFTSVFSLKKILYALGSEEADQFDLMWGPFYVSGNAGLSVSSEMNYVFIHNKYYRLSFLQEHNIRFSEDLYMSEDSAFNTIVRLEIPKNRTGQINTSEPLYAWCRRSGSITMDFSKWLSNVEGHFDRNLYILDEYRKRNLDNYELMVARTITDVYVMLHRTGAPKPSERFVERVRLFYQIHKQEYLAVPEDKVMAAMAAGDKDLGTDEKNKLGRETLQDWIQYTLE
jgi:glycosyltransferase involved in cell wall biosynthesis